MTIKSLNERRSAFIFILLISVIYLFPMFLGKVDTPVDVRNILMYPWRYHSVDKKIKKFNLWKVDLPTPDNTLNIVTFPNKSNKVVIKIDLSNQASNKIIKLLDTNYFISFDSKPVDGKEVTFNFGLLLENRLTKESFTPKYAITPLSNNKGDKNWYRAYLNLNELVKKLPQIKDLNNYDLIIQATSLGHENKLPPLPKDFSFKNTICYDLNYGDKAKLFLDFATQQGAANTIDGFGMLQEQAKVAFLSWHCV